LHGDARMEPDDEGYIERDGVRWLVAVPEGR
jgi:hypothetical protein